jgi:heme/copper-type cytochrome/quinol oxidase subunit 2
MLPVPASPSPAIASSLFWIATTCCAIAQIALIRSAIRAPMAGSPESASMRMPSRASEIAWTIVPAIGLAVLLVFTWRATHRPEMPNPNPHAGHQMIDDS